LASRDDRRKGKKEREHCVHYKAEQKGREGEREVTLYGQGVLTLFCYNGGKRGRATVRRALVYMS